MTIRAEHRNETRDRRGSVRRALRVFALGMGMTMLTTAGGAQAEGALAVELATGAATLSTARAPMRVTFRNTGTSELRILDVFEPLQVFFQFSITRTDGTPVSVPSGGKIDPPSADLRYIAIAPGGSHTRDVDIASLLPASTWVSGDYFVWVTYRNAYGEDGFRGTAESDPIQATIVRAQ